MARQRRQPARPTKLSRIVEEIDKRSEAAERKGLTFTAPTDEQLRKKLRSTKSPMIVFQAWNGLGAHAGGTIDYDIGVHNPDPTDWIWLFVHVFVGPGNMVADPGEALEPVDERYARLTEPEFPGLTLAAGTTADLHFTFAIPPSVEPTNYLGNSYLFQSVWHDVGVYLDRSLFTFQVT